MRTLITGKGSAGSWRIRGEQLGEAIGATVKPLASVKDMDAHDLVVVVKRHKQVLPALQKTKAMVAWDLVDFWPQSQPMELAAATQLARQTFNEMGASFCIYATLAQQQDVQLPGFHLKHHAHPEYKKKKELRERVHVVGYEGSPRYLDQWAIDEVHARGWAFAHSLDKADIGIATRGRYRSKITDRWKSNVKLANFQALGLPCVLPYESGYLEQDTSGPLYYHNRAEFGECLDALASKEKRQWRSMMLRSGVPLLKDVAAKYRRELKYWFQKSGGAARQDAS